MTVIWVGEGRLDPEEQWPEVGFWGHLEAGPAGLSTSRVAALEDGNGLARSLSDP